MPTTSAADPSLLLWLLGALIALLGSHVVLGWARQAQFQHGGRRWLGVALAALLFSTSFGMVCALGLTSEALAFPIGFRAAVVLGVWLSAAVSAIPLIAWFVWRPGLVAALGAGALLALVMIAIQLGWVMAVGFRPGVRWRYEFVVLGAIVTGIGFALSIGLAFPRDECHRRPVARRVAALTLMSLATLAGQALVVAGAGLQMQVGSIYRHEISGSLLSLIGGALLPMVLALVALDLSLRRREQRSRRRRARSRRYRDAARLTAPDALGPTPVDTHAANRPAARLPSSGASAPQSPA